MARLRLPFAIAVVTVVAALVVPSPAMAATSKLVQVTAQEGRDVEFLVYLDPTVDTPPSSDVSSTVVVSGETVPSEATLLQEDARARQVVLVIDVSGSMKGERLAAAKAAAEDYVRVLPKDVDIGLVSFNDAVVTNVPPTADRVEVLAAIDSLTAGGKTALADGLVQGVDLADPQRNARVLLLSDGGDTASQATPDEARQIVSTAGVPVDVVALTPNAEHAAVLTGLATSSGGQYLVAADVAGLQTAFQDATGTFGGRVQVTSTMPPELDASGKFAVVTVAVNGTDYRGSAKLPTTDELASSDPTAASAPPLPQVTVKQDTTDFASFLPWLYGLLAALVVAILALTVVYSRRKQRAYLRTQQVLWYSNVTDYGNQPLPRQGQQQQGVVRALDKTMSGRAGYEARQAKLDNAEMNLTPGSWLIIRVGISLLLVFLLAIVLSSLWLGLIIGLLVGWLATRAYINSREMRRQKAFEEELPDFLLLIASALRSGLSFSQALDSTAAEGKGQVSRQVRRALRESQLGAPIEEALMRAADRMDSVDLRWVVAALAIQREVGGNLSKILETAAATVMGRAELRREVRTLSAEGRLSGWILAALPIGLFFYMLFANREYVSFFWTQTAGLVALAVLAVMFILGFIWVRKIAKIEV